MPPKRRYCLRNHDTAKVGRDTSGRCLQCKRESGRSNRWLRLAEDRGTREAELRRKQEEIDRRLEREYQAAIRRGGYDAAMAKWDRAHDRALDKGYGLCEWQDEVDGQFMGRECYNRTRGIYCWRHNKQLEREQKKKRREREAAERKSPAQ